MGVLFAPFRFVAVSQTHAAVRRPQDHADCVAGRGTPRRGRRLYRRVPQAAAQHMKFSVLLPTRNRLELLRYAIESVRRQFYQDWEIVVSDNDSIEDVRGYVASLGDGRIRYVRTPRFIPVTDNWSNALAHSSGDYVVM